jgi:DNA mismatch endonuclease (patch repair protein)
MDVLTPEQRSRCMSAITGRNTKPELLVRKLVHAMGYRFRLHVRSIPGCPDLVFPSRRKIIFVHGCFWHRHECRFGRVVPATNTVFWQQKILSNVQRDERNLSSLRSVGWTVTVVWECEIDDHAELALRLKKFLHA